LNPDSAPLIVTIMYRISVVALVAAFSAELIADWIIQLCLFMVFAGDSISGDMTNEALQKVYENLSTSPGFTAAVLVFGTATTFGGGYLAARIARKYPYYHGLGMGLIGIAYALYYWQTNELWLDLLSVLSNIPVCIWGAHLAKRHLPPPE
jgi:hypothetical protein